MRSLHVFLRKNVTSDDLALGTQALSALDARSVRSDDRPGPRQLAPPGSLWGEDVFGPRGDQWGVLELAQPLLHPAAAPIVAHALGCTPQGALAIARAEAALVAGCLVAIDPNTFVNPEHAAATGGHALRLVTQNARVQKLLDLAAPISVMPVQLSALQRCFEALLEADPKDETSLWEAPTVHALATPVVSYVGCAFAGTGHVLIQRGTEIEHRSADTGELLSGDATSLVLQSAVLVHQERAFLLDLQRERQVRLHEVRDGVKICQPSPTVGTGGWPTTKEAAGSTP